MCETGKSFGQQWWESAFDSDCCVVHMLSRLTYASLLPSNTFNNNTSLRHLTKTLEPGSKASNTQARSTFSTSLHTWIVKRASPAAAVGIEFPSLPDFAPSKTCIRQPTSHEL
jgi:hypothetical protein